MMNGCKKENIGLKLNEDDTARALRKIPYSELKDLISAGSTFDHMTSMEKADYLELRGWSYDELIEALIAELDASMKEF